MTRRTILLAKRHEVFPKTRVGVSYNTADMKRILRGHTPHIDEVSCDSLDQKDFEEYVLITQNTRIPFLVTMQGDSYYSFTEDYLETLDSYR